MNMDFLTPEFFDTLIIVVMIIGAALVAVRLYKDFTRPLPPPRPPQQPPRNDQSHPNEQP